MPAWSGRSGGVSTTRVSDGILLVCHNVVSRRPPGTAPTRRAEQTLRAVVDGSISVDSGRLINVFTLIGAYLERRNQRETSHDLALRHGR